ncbi:hypothetical protein MTR_2g039330 [Medicago truncatula]|uniref:Uncharacterized protein n=1 Tax=Medicago truncatula TaxID=3880 RepID=G7III6_MEDTR|nr:hypothetical protein MTR_2g039330 [Medicago truncatula]
MDSMFFIILTTFFDHKDPLTIASRKGLMLLIKAYSQNSFLALSFTKRFNYTLGDKTFTLDNIEQDNNFFAFEKPLVTTLFD